VAFGDTIRLWEPVQISTFCQWEKTKINVQFQHCSKIKTGLFCILCAWRNWQSIGTAACSETEQSRH
ncbi:MAG: hypothetical protein ACPG6T_04145, partial [Paracoccaceae bacterium]